MILTDLSIRYRTAVLSSVVFFILAGAHSYINLPKENFPDITVPFVFISTRYEGVAPEEVENLITIHMEKKLKSLDKIKEISSSSIEESSNITIEFYPEQDIDSAVQKVKDKIDLARQDIPEDIDEPVVSEINLSTDIPILTVAFYGGQSLSMLKKVIEDIKDRVETVPGVLEARIFGDREREIRVEVDIGRLNAYGVPVFKIIELLSNENSTVSAGNIEMSGARFQVRVPGEFISPEEMKSLIVTYYEGAPVYLTDFAQIKDTYKDITTISRLKGEPCLSLMIQKRSGENILKVIDAVKKVFEEERGKLPAGIEYKITSDLSKDTFDMLRELENNIVSGLLLVLIVLFFSMGLRNSIFVAIAIPISMLISFTVMTMLSIRLNMIVLFSLILSLGMLVDNGIVIVENIFRHRCEGLDAMASSRIGSSEVAVPVITSTLTTVLAFLPLVFWPDTIGKFMAFLPKTVIITLLASLFVGIAVNPAICSIFVKPPVKGMAISRLCGAVGRMILNAYSSMLRGCLASPGLVCGISAMIFLLVLILFARFGAGVELFPDADPRRSVIQIKFPEGTEINKSDSAASEIEKRLLKYEDIVYVLTTVGQGGGNFFEGGSTGPQLASLQIEYKPFETRKYFSDELTEAIRLNVGGMDNIVITTEKPANEDYILVSAPQNDIRPLEIFLESLLKFNNIKVPVQAIACSPSDESGKLIRIFSSKKIADDIRALIEHEKDAIPGAETIVNKEKEGPATGAPISIEVSGDDFSVLSGLAEQIKILIRDTKGLADLRDDHDDARPELKFIVDRKKAALLGLDTATVAKFVRTAINGLEVSKFRQGEDEYDITIRLPESQRQSTDALLNMQLPIPGKSPVALSSLGKFDYSEGFGTIVRKNHNRTITIDGDVVAGYGADKILSEISSRLKGFQMPSGYSIRFRGENEDQEKNFDFLMKAFFIAIGLIGIILIIQFNSIFLPLIIMTSVILSFIGVLASLLIFDMRFSIIMTGLGIISLAGVVVNNSIVLVDCIIQQKAKGFEPFDAAYNAGRLRLRPVLLTAVTTILGLIPMAVGWSLEIHSFPPRFISGAESSQWWAPMAIVVIFGLSVSTLLTLVLSPCLFLILDKVHVRLTQLSGLRNPQNTFNTKD